MSDRSMTRRDMLRTTAAGTAGAAILSAAAAPARAQVPTKGQIRFGVIGIGNRVRAHFPILKGLADRCRVTATCDIIPERADGGAKIAGGDVATFANHVDLLQSGLCDAVLITTPNYTHKEISLDALRRGHHVFCEKPMATTLPDAREIVKAVRESRRVFAVGLQFRYAAVYLEARRLIDEGAIGDLKYVWADEFRGDWAQLYDDPEVNARKNWRLYQDLSGGTLIEKNCHDFDILGWVINASPARVTASGGNCVYMVRETIDHATVAVDYVGGTKLVLGMCLFAKRGRATTTLIGTDGTMEFPRGGTAITIRRPGGKDEVIDVKATSEDKYGHRGTQDLHIDFLDAIAQGRPPRADVNVGYTAMRVPIAAETAIREDRVIEMDTFEG